MTSEEIVLLRKIAESLQELVDWTKLTTRYDARQRLQSILDTDVKLRVYELTDGKRSVREIAGLAPANKDVISAWWREWDALGIVEQVRGRRGRRRKIVSLEALGIEVPPLPKQEEE